MRILFRLLPGWLSVQIFSAVAQMPTLSSPHTEYIRAGERVIAMISTAAQRFNPPGDPDQTVWSQQAYSQFLGAANLMYAKGITTGYNNGTYFAADQPVPRGAMAAFLIRAWSLRVYGSVEGWRQCNVWTQYGQPSSTAFHRGAQYQYFQDAPDDSGGNYCGTLDGTPNTAVATGFYAYIQKSYELGVTTGLVAPTLNLDGTVNTAGTYGTNSNTTNLQICIFGVRARWAAEKPCKSVDNTCARTLPASYGTYPTSPYFQDVPPTDGSFQQAQLAQKWGAFSTTASVPGCGSPIGWMCAAGDSKRAQMAGVVVRMVLGDQSF